MIWEHIVNRKLTPEQAKEVGDMMKLWRDQAPEGVIITGPGHEIKPIGQKPEDNPDENSTLP